MTQKDLTKLTKYINCILNNSSNVSVGKYLHDIIDFCRINLVNELTEEELMDLSCASFPCDGDTDARSFHKGFKAGYRKAK